VSGATQKSFLTFVFLFNIGDDLGGAKAHSTGIARSTGGISEDPRGVTADPVGIARSTGRVMADLDGVTRSPAG
jgi:hypothetical protein